MEPGWPEITIIRQGEPASVTTLRELALRMAGQLVKAVVDVDQEIMAIGGQMHADEESLLLDGDSNQGDLWGINLYPDDIGTDDFVEFDSMINLRPGQGNRTRSVDDADTRAQIRAIVARLVEP